jgi:hypothetical protein
MNRVLRIVVLLMLSPCALLSQHHGSHSAGTTNTPTGVSTSDDLKDFKLAVAMQASPEQIAQFQMLSQGVAEAQKATREILQLPATGPKPDFPRLQALSDEVDEMLARDRKFLASFSSEQKSGLKPITKKVAKADSEIAKQNKDLQRAGDQPIVGIVEKLDRALGDLQAQQLEIAKQMGIQLDSSSLDTKK